MTARTACQLATGHSIAIKHTPNLVKAQIEHVMQKKCRPLQRRQTIKRHHQRQCDVIAAIFFVLDKRFRQPCAGIGFTPHACGFQMVKRKTADHAREPALRLADGFPIRSTPAQPCVLHNIFGFGMGPHHTIGNADEPRTQSLEHIRIFHLWFKQRLHRI
ncbi:hypothetical protein D9M69_557200 [compost metagenome]